MSLQNNGIVAERIHYFSKMTELNNLGHALAIQPHQFEGKMMQLFSTKSYFSDNPLSSIAWKEGAREEISSNEFEWRMKGANARHLVVLENVEPSSNLTLGKGRTTFRVKLDQSWYGVGDVITPGTSGHRYQCRIQEDPVPHGNGFVYVVRLVSDNFNDFIPQALVQAGQKWIKLFSTYGEGDVRDGTTQLATSYKFRGSLGKLRKHYSVTDYVAEQVLAVRMQDSKGKVHDKWMNYCEVEFWQQWYREVERAYWYNRKATTVESSTGRNVDSFAGIHQQLESSRQEYYTELTARLLEDFLMDVSYSRVKPGSRKKIRVFTGEVGMLLFHRAMQDLLDKRGWMIGDSVKAAQSVKSEYSPNAYAVGYQFVEYIMHNGTSLELVHNPIYDDTEINTEIDPITGKPVESMKFTFLDFSGEGDDSNIKIVDKKDGFKFGYQAGLVSPYGPAKGGLMSHAGEFYSMHVSKETAIKIHDFTKCGQLIFKRVSA